MKGHDAVGGIAGSEFIFDEDYAVRYDFAFPIQGISWTKVIVAWRDLIPVLSGLRARPLGEPGGNLSSRLSGLWFGKWWYWGDFPALTFNIDEICLEPHVDRIADIYRPVGAPRDRLVTIFFGGNDWDAGMRGAEFQRACVDAVDRIRRAPHGTADMLLVTTNPSAVRWNETKELAEVCRWAARTTNAGLADTERMFQTAGRNHRNRLFVHDRVHLSRTGHEIVADTIQTAIETLGDSVCLTGRQQGRCSLPVFPSRTVSGTDRERLLFAITGDDDRCLTAWLGSRGCMEYIGERSRPAPIQSD